jgi:hypothetical protein
MEGLDKMEGSDLEALALIILVQFQLSTACAQRFELKMLLFSLYFA